MWLGLLKLVGGQLLGALFSALAKRLFPAKSPAPVVTLQAAETVLAPVTVAKAVAAIEDKGLG